MKTTYPIKGNPICPYSKNECNNQDMDGYTDCSGCVDYCNGVRATGEMPFCNWLFIKVRSFFSNNA